MRGKRFVYQTARKRRGRVPLMLFAVIAFIIVGIALYTVMDDGKIDVVRHYVTVSNLPESLEGFTVLLVSDLAGANFGNKQMVLAEAAKKHTYHAVVVNGDFTGANGNADALIQFILALGTTRPIYFIQGDGDPAYNPNDPNNPYAAAVRAGAVWLSSTLSTTYRGSTVWFVPERMLIENDPTAQLALYNAELSGLIRRSGTEEGARQYAFAQHEIASLEREIASREAAKPDELTIAVLHKPLDGARADTFYEWSLAGDAFYRGIDAFLAGHYAAGQWRVPGVGALYVNGLGFFPGDANIMGKSYIYGWTQIISGGLGKASDSPFPGFRLFNTPELTFVTFTRYLQ